MGMEATVGFQPIVTENRPLFCMGCRKQGHIFSSCGRNPENKVVGKDVQVLGSSKDSKHKWDKMGSRKSKKWWQPTGKILELKDVHSIQDHANIPISKVLQTLKKDLVIVDKPDFLWDDDPEIRDMLAKVFQEEGEGFGQDEERIADTSQDADSNEKNGSDTMHVSSGLKKKGVDQSRSLDSVALVLESTVVLAVGKDGSLGNEDLVIPNIRSPSRPRKKVSILHSGYANESCASAISNAKDYRKEPVTRSQSFSSGLHNAFQILSDEECGMEC